MVDSQCPTQKFSEFKRASRRVRSVVFPAREEKVPSHVSVDKMQLVYGVIYPCVALIFASIFCIVSAAVNLKDLKFTSEEFSSEESEDDIQPLNTTVSLPNDDSYCSFYAAEFYDDAIIFADSLIVSKVFTTQSIAPRAIAFDRNEQLLFWAGTSSSDENVYKFQLKKQGRTTAIFSSMNHVHDLVLDTVRQLIFLSIDAEGILRMNYNGSERQWVRTQPGLSCLGMALDPQAIQLYFVDSSNDQVLVCDYSSVDDCSIFEADAGHEPSGLTLDVKNQQLYWILRTSAQINMKSTNSSLEKVMTAGQPKAIDVRSLVMCRGTLYYASFMDDGGIYKFENSIHFRVTQEPVRSPIDICLA